MDMTWVRLAIKALRILKIIQQEKKVSFNKKRRFCLYQSSN